MEARTAAAMHRLGEDREGAAAVDALAPSSLPPRCLLGRPRRGKEIRIAMERRGRCQQPILHIIHHPAK